MKRIFWIFLQILAIFLLCGALPISYLLDHPTAGWLVFTAIVLLHLGELLVTIPLAQKRQLTLGIAIIKTLLFGFTWWIPFRQGLLRG